MISHLRTVLVTGATGHQGGAVARHLLNRGYRVRALTRDPSKPAARSLEAHGAQIVGGDLNDGPSMVEAARGCDGVYSVQSFQDAGYDGEIRQGINIAKAAREAGVRQLVYSSVAGASDDIDVPHFQTKYEIEQAVKDSGAAWTIIRPVFFMQNWEARRREITEQGRIAAPLNPRRGLQQVSVEDIGEVAAIAFDDPDDWSGRTLELAGDEMTLPEVASSFAHVLHRPVQYVHVPWIDFEVAAGPEMTKMWRWFEERGYTVELLKLRQILPWLMSFDRYLEENWSAARVK